VNLSQGYVESNVRLGPNIHACVDGEEIIRIEQIVLEDESIRAEIEKLKLPEGSVVVCDPWIYGKFFLCYQYLNPVLTTMNRLGWYQR
jgi:primary-amine oxidase